jgi:hypothetical protein
MILLIVRLYRSYRLKGDPNPEMKITGYLAMVLYFITWCIILPLIEVINLKFPNNNLKFDRAVWVITSLVISYFYYRVIYKYLFTYKRMKVWEKRYKAFYIPTFLLYTVVILLPVLLMLLGPTLAVLLTGGEILGNKVTGVLE